MNRSFAKWIWGSMFIVVAVACPHGEVKAQSRFLPEDILYRVERNNNKIRDLKLEQISKLFREKTLLKGDTPSYYYELKPDLSKTEFVSSEAPYETLEIIVQSPWMTSKINPKTGEVKVTDKRQDTPYDEDDFRALDPLNHTRRFIANHDLKILDDLTVQQIYVIEGISQIDASGYHRVRLTVGYEYGLLYSIERFDEKNNLIERIEYGAYQEIFTGFWLPSSKIKYFREPDGGTLKIETIYFHIRVNIGLDERDFEARKILDSMR